MKLIKRIRARLIMGMCALMMITGTIGVTTPSAEAAATGMSFAQAQSFVTSYKSLQGYYKSVRAYTYGNAKHYQIYNAGCPGGALANCVAMSQYFVNRYTTVPDWKRTVTASSVASTLASTYKWSKGSKPKAYSIFSGRGHTGVVLGINANGSMIIAEAACGYYSKGIKVRQLTLDQLKRQYGSVTFVYPNANQLTGLVGTEKPPTKVNLDSALIKPSTLKSILDSIKKS